MTFLLWYIFICWLVWAGAQLDDDRRKGMSDTRFLIGCLFTGVIATPLMIGVAIGRFIDKTEKQDDTKN